MYIPKQFRITDHGEAIDFIRKFSFGTLVTVENGLPIATHIPFVVSQQGHQVALTSHIALANPQCNTLTNGKVLTIFTEPHAYISPSHYEKQESVPTWNYLAVHAYGYVTIIEEQEEKQAALKEMITFFNDPDYLTQWDGLPYDFKVNMAKGIVAFKIIVDDLQGQKKLSQNKTVAEKRKIIDTLSASGNTLQNNLADYMKKENS